MPSAKPIYRIQDKTRRIRRLISILRGRRGCAWDRRQTPRTLAPLLIEEAYEVIDAVERGDRRMIREEMGDLIFLVMSIFHALESRRVCSYGEVLTGAVKKYIFRHPHVFASRRRMSPDAILSQWERQKAASDPRNPIDRVPIYLPAIYQAKRLYDKASRLGLVRLKKSKRRRNPARMGQKILGLIRASVQSDIDPDAALRGAIRDLRKRLKRVYRKVQPRSRRGI